MFNLETFVTYISRLISGSHFRTDCKVEDVSNRTKYYLKLSVSDKDYNLYRFELSNGEIDILALREVEFLGVVEDILTSIKLKDISEYGQSTVVLYIIKTVMVHYAFSKAGLPIPLPYSVPTSFSFKPEDVESEILTSVANSILRNTNNATLELSVLPNSFWINVGCAYGVLVQQVNDKFVAVLVFNIGCDGMTGGTSYKYIYHDVYSAVDIISLNELVTKVADICY